MFELFSRESAKGFKETWPIGNGHIGARITGDFSHSVISFNDDTFFSGRKENREPLYSALNVYQIKKYLMEDDPGSAEMLAVEKMASERSDVESYCEIGRLSINVSRETFSFCRKLSFDSAVYSEAAINERGLFSKEAFSSFKDDFFFISYAFPCKSDIILSFDSLNGKDSVVTGDGLIVLNGRYKNESGIDGLDYSIGLKCYTDGIAQNIEKEFKISDATCFYGVVYSNTDYNIDKLDADRDHNCFSATVNALSSVDPREYKKIRTEHIKEYHRLFSKTGLHIETKDKEEFSFSLLFNMSKYLLLSSSGPFSTLPAGVTGIWKTDKSEFGMDDFSTDEGFQMNYWNAHLLNLSETTKVINRFIEALAEESTITASYTYGINRGWTVNRNASPFGNTYISGNIQNGMFPHGGGLLSSLLVPYAEFTGDNGYIVDKGFRILLDSCDFYDKLLMMDYDRRHAFAPTSSHGNLYLGNDSKKHYLCHGDTFGHMMTDKLFLDTVGLAELIPFEERKPIQRKLSNIRRKSKRIAPYKISERYEGKLCEWMEDYPEENRNGHIFHLYGVFPGDRISCSKENELVCAARKSALRIIENEDLELFTISWLLNICARLNMSEFFVFLAKKLVEKYNVSRETFFYSPYLSAFAAGLVESVLQSHDGEVFKRNIDLFPSLPNSWTSGSISGVRARGCLTVSLEWTENRFKVEIVPDSDCDVNFIIHDVLNVVFNEETVPVFNNMLSAGLKGGKKYRIEYERVAK